MCFDVLCSFEFDRDFEEFELETAGDDDENVSVVSSTMGSFCNGETTDNLLDATLDEDSEEDWDPLNEEERDSSIKGSLQKLGNVKKRRMSTFIMKDMLGDDAKSSLAGVKKSHAKNVRQNKLMINEIYRAVKYFDQKFKIRRNNLEKSIVQSRNQTYTKRNYS